MGAYRGTREGPTEGVPPTGDSVAVPVVSVISASDDGVTSLRNYWEQQAFAEQLGFTFPGIVPTLPRIAAAKLGDVL